MIIAQIIQIAFLCIVAGVVSIPLSFAVTSNPFVVWFGNALGSLISAMVVLYVANRISSKKFRDRISKHRPGKKIVTVFEQGEDNHKVQRARIIINRRGLRIFSFICPIFPGALIGTVAVCLLDLDRKIYRFWLTLGIFFVSGLYVFSYWFTFVRPH